MSGNDVSMTETAQSDQVCMQQTKKLLNILNIDKQNKFKPNSPNNFPL